MVVNNEEVFRLISKHLDKGVKSFFELTQSDKMRLTYAYLNCDYKWAHEFLTEDERSEQMLNMFIDYIGNPTMETGYSCLELMKEAAIHFNGERIEEIFREVEMQRKQANPRYKPKSWQEIISEEIGIPLQGSI